VISIYLYGLPTLIYFGVLSGFLPPKGSIVAYPTSYEAFPPIPHYLVNLPQGTFKLLPDQWQYINLPLTGTIRSGFMAALDNVVIDRGYILDQYIEIASCYHPDINKWRTYIVGLTDATNPNNFLIPTGIYAQGFWVKTLDWTVFDPLDLTLNWVTDPTVTEILL